MPKLAEPGDQPLHLRFESKNPLARFLLGIGGRVLEWVFNFKKARKLFRENMELGKTTDLPFFERSLKVLHVDWEVEQGSLENIPKEGAVVTVSNHPYGMLEGLVLAALLRKARPDMKLMANQFLTRFPGTDDDMIAVDVLGGKSSTHANSAKLKEAMRWLKDEHLLGVFPAGEVSRFSLRTQRVADNAWSPMIGRIIKRTNASVVPIYFDGSNGFFFHLLGFIHPRLQTLALPRVLLRQMGRTVKVRVGKPIAPDKLVKMDDERMMASLRLRTYMLNGEKELTIAEREAGAPKPMEHQPLIERDPPEVLEEEISALPADCKLHDHGEMQIYVAKHEQIPRVMRELGRLRELTFRQVGEGTGNPDDVDRFDKTYTHLFIWHKADREVAGAYRLGQTDVILPAEGVEGLYTNTLFKLKRKLIEQINPALELGRSFVQPRYQRSYAPLMLLWKGIGLYMGNNPRYRYMFGPVSISNDYQSTSKQLMIAFLEETSTAAALAKMLKARTPPTLPRFKSWELRATSKAVQSIEDVSQLISEVEDDQKGVPILIKQYLKLGATLLAMNVDPDFGDVLDGLMVCDLTKTDQRTLRRYMGQELADGYIQYHEERGNRKKPKREKASAKG